MEGKILKHKLMELNKTQKELSELLGITSQSVNAILSAKDVRSGTIERIGRNRQTLWGGCADANPKLSTNDT